MSLEDFFVYLCSRFIFMHTLNLFLCIQQIILHAYNKSKISMYKMIDCKRFAFIMYQFVVKTEFLIIICWLLHKC
jgi:hypothetical protein